MRWDPFDKGNIYQQVRPCKKNTRGFREGDGTSVCTMATTAAAGVVTMTTAAAAVVTMTTTTAAAAVVKTTTTTAAKQLGVRSFILTCVKLMN